MPHHPDVLAHRGTYTNGAAVVPRVPHGMPALRHGSSAASVCGDPVGSLCSRTSPVQPPRSPPLPSRGDAVVAGAGRAERLSLEVPRYHRAVMQSPVNDDGDPAELVVRLAQVPDERGGVEPIVLPEQLLAVVHERLEHGKLFVAARVQDGNPLAHERLVLCAPSGAVHECRPILRENCVALARQAQVPGIAVPATREPRPGRPCWRA